jgi:hypothetical protein
MVNGSVLKPPAAIKLALALLALASLLVIIAGGGKITRNRLSQRGESEASVSETFVNPPEISSSNGVLNATRNHNGHEN